MSLMLILLERYIAIRHPFKYVRLVKRCNVVIAVIVVWSYSLLVALLSMASHDMSDLHLKCQVNIPFLMSSSLSFITVQKYSHTSCDEVANTFCKMR